jgi:hypothetical protein
MVGQGHDTAKSQKSVTGLVLKKPPLSRGRRAGKPLRKMVKFKFEIHDFLEIAQSLRKTGGNISDKHLLKKFARKIAENRNNASMWTRLH